MSDVTFDMQNNKMHVHEAHAEPWKVTLVDTGDSSMTGGRIRRIADYVRDDEAFCLTYGDGVGNIDVGASIAFHQQHKRLATVTAAYPQAKFGALDIEGDRVAHFQEKPKGDNGMVSAGFFVLSPKVIDYIAGDETSWEASPLQNLAIDDQLSVFRHDRFWQPMDTLRDKQHLEQLWQSGKAPWKVWS
jgi:glucose-1-phosphate cytidylyltransferase